MIYRAAFKQSGAIEVEEMEELFDAAKAFEMYKDLGGTVTHIKNPVRKATVKAAKKGKKK